MLQGVRHMVSMSVMQLAAACLSKSADLHAVGVTGRACRRKAEIMPRAAPAKAPAAASAAAKGAQPAAKKPDTTWDKVPKKANAKNKNKKAQKVDASLLGFATTTNFNVLES